MGRRGFWHELRRRHVWRVAVAYAAVGWLLIEAATQVFPVFHMPDWAAQLVVLLIAIGFPVAVILAWAFEITPEGVRRTEPVDSPAVRSPTQHQRVGTILNAFIIAVLAAAVGVLAWRLTANRRAPAAVAASASGPAPTTSASTAASAAANAIPAKSIAVLPFQNLSDDKNNAYFAEGMQDLILTRLAEIGGLKVISRTSTMKYQSHPDDLKTIGRELGVATVLEGSVQKAGKQVLINVQLVDARSDSHIWAHDYTRTLDNVFGVEGEVAQKVADALRAKLTDTEQKSINARLTDNPQAYDAYLRGLVLERKLTGFSPGVLRRIEANYARAVKLDPTFAQAWARLSDTRTTLYANFIDRSPSVLRQAKQDVDTALRLNPALGEAYLALARYHYLGMRDMAGALPPLAKARNLLPNSADVLSTLAAVEERQDQWQRANEHLRLASELDPRNVGRLEDLAASYSALRKFSQARAMLDRALVLAPSSSNLLAFKAQIYMREGNLDAAGSLLGKANFSAQDPYTFYARVQYFEYRHDYAKAIAELQRAAADPKVQPDALHAIYRSELALMLAYDGQSGAARAQARQARDKLLAARRSDADDHLLASYLATSYAVLGDKRAALHWSHRDVEANSTCSVCEAGAEALLAAVQARFGETNQALSALPHLLTAPNGPTVAELRLDPMWDPLRKDPRFQALLEQHAYHKPAVLRAAQTTPAPATTIR